MTNEIKIEWNDEIEADSNGDDRVEMSESVDGRFDIAPNYVSGENPSYFTLIDHTTRKQKSFDSVAQCKKHALEIVNAVVWTREMQIQWAANDWHMNPKLRENIASKAFEKFGVDVSKIAPKVIKELVR